MNDIFRDFRFAARQLGRTPAFAATAVAILALGVGSVTAVFTIVNSLLLRPLPVADQSRLVNVHRTRSSGESLGGFSYPAYEDFRDHNSAFTGMAAFNGTAVTLGSAEARPLVGLQAVSSNFFSVLGVAPARGRAFRPEEERPGGPAVAIVSDGFWRRRTGADPGLLGKTITLNGHPFTVVGIAPPSFTGTFVGFPFEVWVPLGAAGSVAPGHDRTSRTDVWLEAVARLKPGLTAGTAAPELDGLAARLGREFPSERVFPRVRLAPLRAIDDGLWPSVVRLLSFLLAIAVLVYLIACANVASMLIARSSSRRGELAIRIALGANRYRLVRQLLTESISICVAGGALGIPLASAAVRSFSAFNLPSSLPLSVPLPLDFRVLFVSAGASLASALLFGLAPALLSTRNGISSSLAVDASRSTSGKSTARNVFVVGQLAISLFLVVCAGLFFRTLHRARELNPGFDLDRVETVPLTLSVLGLSDERSRALADDVVRGVSSLPGVRSASAAQRVPLAPGRSTYSVRIDGVSPPPGETAFPIDGNVVSTGFFRTLGASLLEGRDFSERDRAESVPVAIVSASMARRFWPGHSPIGRRFSRVGDSRGGFRQGEQPVPVTTEIVGVAPDLAPGGRRSEAFVYFPSSQLPISRLSVVFRTEGGRETGLAEGVRRVVRQAAPALPPAEIFPARASLEASLLPQRIAGSFAAVLGAIGLALAAVGIYALVAYNVGRRSREIAIRLAVGARPADVLLLVLKEGATLAAAGIGSGLLISFLLTRLFASLLFGLAPSDPASFAAGASLLAFATLAASYFPARRAAATDPAGSLRAP